MTTRREFMKNTALATGCLCTGTLAIVPACKMVAYVPHQVQSGKIIVRKADFGQGRHVVVEVEKLPAPIYVSHLKDGSYSAVLMKCTHRGCEVMPLGDILHCPCHGSEYTHTGKVIQSPAIEDLRPFAVTSEGDYLYIETGAI